MSSKYPGGFITKSPVAPTSSAASGMWTLDQAMQLQKQGNWPSPPPSVIGQAYGGGYYAGQIGVSGVATHYLVVGPVSTAQNTNKQYKTSATSTTGASSDIDGPANSAAMNATNHPAAFFCEGLTIGGFTDWYMPAKNELEVCYFNLKPTTTANNTTTFPSGINPNSVPARTSNYTSGDPTQTTATNFRSTGAEGFAQTYYWASTEETSSTGWRQRFTNGSQNGYQKNYGIYVRAIRRVAV